MRSDLIRVRSEVGSMQIAGSAGYDSPMLLSVYRYDVPAMY